MGFANAINSAADFLNGYIWGIGMLFLIVGTGLVFTVGLGFFQFVHFGDMWKRIFDKQDSDSGISSFSFLLYHDGHAYRYRQYRRRSGSSLRRRSRRDVLGDHRRYDELGGMFRRVYTSFLSQEPDRR